MMCWSFYKDVDDFVASVHSWKYSEWHSPFILSPQQLRPHPSPWAISTANSPALSSLFPPIAFVFGSVQDFTHSAYTHTHTHTLFKISSTYPLHLPWIIPLSSQGYAVFRQPACHILQYLMEPPTDWAFPFTVYIAL